MCLSIRVQLFNSLMVQTPEMQNVVYFLNTFHKKNIFWFFESFRSPVASKFAKGANMTFKNISMQQKLIWLSKSKNLKSIGKVEKTFCKKM
jgi:hypothetical protein